MAGAPSTRLCSDRPPAPRAVQDQALKRRGFQRRVPAQQIAQHVLLQHHARRQAARRAGLGQRLGAAHVDGRDAQRQVARAVLHRVAPGERTIGGRADGTFRQQAGHARAVRDTPPHVHGRARAVRRRQQVYQAVRYGQRGTADRLVIEPGARILCHVAAAKRGQRRALLDHDAAPAIDRIQEDFWRPQHRATAHHHLLSIATYVACASFIGSRHARHAADEHRPRGQRVQIRGVKGRSLRGQDGRLSRRQDLNPAGRSRHRQAARIGAAALGYVEPRRPLER
ncbi:hypothetical protein G6F65_017170 [Rhizopus arrhizus]|nr:hypothetical protein G6F65_017170 [Rhizopus arrhizus]